MKRSLFLCFLLAAGVSSQAANSLLTSPVTAALGHTKLKAMGIASNAKDVVLLLADGTSLYALDINDNDPKELAANAITSIPDFVNSKLKPVAGGATLNIIDIEVNPISKAVYVLATDAVSSYVFKVRNNGADITMLNLSGISHSKLTFGSTFAVNDMTWGNNKLYASSGSFSLDGGVAVIAAPFTHGTTITQKATSMFKSNWGGSYVTKAPLETMTYGMVKTKHRLMGVTTCAPGFSLDADKLAGAGTIQVSEDFNMNMGMSAKVVFQRHDGKDWLFDLHDGNLYRVGEKMLDGSQVTAGKFNSASEMLRNNSGAPAPGLAADVIKQVPGSFLQIALFDDYRMVVLEAGGTLRMLQTAVSAPGLSIDDLAVSANTLRVYPNPARNTLNVDMPESSSGVLQVFGMDGRLLQTNMVSGSTAAIDISGLASGQYLLKAVNAGADGGQSIFLVK